jgi:FMN phosphatase YigB (HAD superfamily)
MRPEDIDAMVFDFGGVLVSIDFDLTVARWAELAGQPFAALRSRFSHGDAYQRHERGEIDAAGYFESLRRDLGVALDDAQLADGWGRVFVDEIAPTIALLPRLAERVPLYLFSNTNPTHYAQMAARFGPSLAPLRKHFLSSSMGLRKPERAAFEALARGIGAQPSRILFFDDLEENVAGARAAGLHAVLVRTPDDVARAVAPWLEEPRR